MPTTAEDRLAALEDERLPVQYVSGRDDYTLRELQSIIFKVPLTDWQSEVLLACPDVRKRMLEQHELTKRLVAAGDAENWPEMYRVWEERRRHHIATVMLFGDLFKVARYHDQADYQEKLTLAAFRAKQKRDHKAKKGGKR